jgi:hypothetical protein
MVLKNKKKPSPIPHERKENEVKICELENYSEQDKR